MLSSLKLQRTTPLGKQQLKKVKTIWQSLNDNNQSFDFRNPVDWKAMGLTDYGFIIKHPMDLSTVSRKLREDKYVFVEEVLDDIQLVWDNCKTYNQSGSVYILRSYRGIQWIYNIAEKLERSFKKMVKNYLPSIPITIPGRTTIGGKIDEKDSGKGNLFEEQQVEQISYNEKLKFSEKLKHLTADQLGTIVQNIIENAPTAFKEVDGERAQIIVDNLEANLFRKLNEQIDSMTAQIQDKVSKKVKQND